MDTSSKYYIYIDFRLRLLSYIRKVGKPNYAKKRWILYPDYTQPFVRTYKGARKTTLQQLRWTLSRTFHLTYSTLCFRYECHTVTVNYFKLLY